MMTKGGGGQISKNGWRLLWTTPFLDKIHMFRSIDLKIYDPIFFIQRWLTITFYKRNWCTILICIMLIENDFSNYCMWFHRMKQRRITRTWSLFWYIKQYHNKAKISTYLLLSSPIAQNSHSGPVIYEKIITITERTESISRKPDWILRSMLIGVMIDHHAKGEFKKIRRINQFWCRDF